jgi:hypothetical protein
VDFPRQRTTALTKYTIKYARDETMAKGEIPICAAIKNKKL